MRSIFLLLTIISFSLSVHAQLKELNPTSVDPLNLSAEGEKQFNDDKKAFVEISNKISNDADYEKLSKNEKDIMRRVDETQEDYWDIIGGGCSWYCGGGPRDVTASSALSGQGQNTYSAENAHDLNYKTAWVEGVSGYGIGQYLLYKFSPEAARINEIIIVNGYAKSETAWKNNSRVKKLKMYLNDKPYAILNLEDARANQHFKVDPIGNSDRANFDKLKTLPPWTIKFEIMDVYKGAQYDDVAITEIYFDGLDVHCFAKGTVITLPGDNTKNIEDLVVGEQVMTLDRKTGELQTAVVEKLEKVVHHNLVKYVFDNGKEIIATQDHPFMVKDRGWASMKPENSLQYNGFDKVGKIEINDAFLTGEDRTARLVKIEHISGHHETYTISKLAGGDNFFANGFVVGVEDAKEGY
jgi:hypothetical protein